MYNQPNGRATIICNSFYDIFLFVGLMHDAFDGGIKYEAIDIIKDVDLGKYGKLIKGTQFECVEMHFLDYILKEPSLLFTNYIQKPDSSNTWYPDPATSIRIPLRVMSAHCVWME